MSRLRGELRSPVPTQIRADTRGFGAIWALARRQCPMGWPTRREDAERFVEQVRGDYPKLASHLGIDERELDAGGLH